MEELLDIVAVAVGFAALIPTAIICVCAGIIGIGAGLALWRYGGVWWRTVKLEPLPALPLRDMMPAAMRGYVFDKGYRDWAQVLREVFTVNTADGRRRWNDARAEPAHWVKRALQRGLAAGQMALGGPLIIAGLAAVHAMLLVTATVLSALLIGLLRGVEQLTMLARRFVFRCPRCYMSMPLPVYLCPDCGTGHARLMSSRSGAWRHRCRCGRHLPALVFLNRGALPSRCPTCKFELSRAHTEAANICVPIIGATSVGKTAFAFSLCREIRENVAPAQGLQSHFLSAEAEQAYCAAESAAALGCAPDKTVERVPHAMDLALERDGKLYRTVYFYDPAGEVFTDGDYLSQHRFLNYPDGILLILDPFAFEPLARQVGAATLGLVRASELDPDRVATGLLNSLEKNFGLPPRARSRTPLAVVVNKIDAAGLEGLIGEPAIDNARREQPNDSVQQVRDRIIHARLLAWGQAALVQQLEARFRCIGYFATSALGRSEDSSSVSLRSHDVLAPFTWLLAQNGESWRPEVIK